MATRSPVEHYPITVGPDITGLIVVRHAATGHVEHVTVSANVAPPLQVFEASRDLQSKRWTLYGTRRGWVTERFNVERWGA